MKDYTMNLQTELKDYQNEAFQKLKKIKVGALYMEMGTGKTRTVIEFIRYRYLKNKINYVIWLCPCSTKENLKKEIIKHIGHLPDYIEIYGIESLSTNIKLNSYLRNLANAQKCFLIVDESNLVKNHKALRSKNIQQISEKCNYKMILNGTPIARNEADLYWQWYILDWRILGYRSYWSFAYNHIEYDEYGNIRRTLNTDYLARKIAPYTYQKKKTEVLNLPGKVYNSEYCYMTDEQRNHYNEIADEYLFNIDETKPETIYRLFAALQNVISGKKITSKYEEKIETINMFKEAYDNPRIEKLIDIISEEKTIIFCKYTHEIESVEKVLKQIYGVESVVTFYGKLNLNKRNESIYKFSNESKYFIANKNCGAYGLNLQFCNNIIYYSNDWDFATRSQSEDRIHRIGQENEVNITDLICHNSLDERIIKCLNKKEKLSDAFKHYINRFKNLTERRKWINGKDIQE